MWVFRKKHPKDALSVEKLFPPKRTGPIALAFGIGEAIISAIVSLATFGTTGVTFGGLTGAIIAIGGAIVDAALSIGVSFGISAAFGQSKTDQSISNNGRIFNTKSVAEPLRLIFGIAREGGNWTYEF